MHKELYVFVETFHQGKENSINMTWLSERFGITDRQCRQLVHDINYNNVLCNGYKGNNKIIGDSNGYYMIGTEEERRRFRGMVVHRLKRDIRLLKAIDSNGTTNQIAFDFDTNELETINRLEGEDMQLLTTIELCKVLNLSLPAMRNMLRDDKDIPYIMVGKVKRFKAEDVIRYLDHKTKQNKA